MQKNVPFACVILFLWKGSLVKLFWIKSLLNETSEMSKFFCRDFLIELWVNDENCTAFGVDNTNINVGRSLHKGADIVYSKLK